MQRQLRSIADQFVDGATIALPGDAIVNHESHVNDPTTVIRTDSAETPARFTTRGPWSLSHSGLPSKAEGEPMATLTAARGSLRTIKGEVGR